MKHTALLLVALSVLAFTGCTQTMPQGTVAMKIDATTAHVCIRAQEVKVGDTIGLYRNECKKTMLSSKGSNVNSCDLIKVGQGRISSILNSHYSEAQFPANVEFKEGDVVEKE